MNSVTSDEAALKYLRSVVEKYTNSDPLWTHFKNTWEHSEAFILNFNKKDTEEKEQIISSLSIVIMSYVFSKYILDFEKIMNRHIPVESILTVFNRVLLITSVEREQS